MTNPTTRHWAVPEPLAQIWPTDQAGETWADSRGYIFKLVSGAVAPLGWGCTVCMNDGEPSTIEPADMVFVDADYWPWLESMGYPAFIHMRHFSVERGSVNTDTGPISRRLSTR